PKYVASRSLKAPLAWNATLLDGDTAKEIAKLKEQQGSTLLPDGGRQLKHTLLRHNLVDEFRLVVFPFVFGRGPRIFETFDVMSLTLLETKRFGYGAVALHYQPKQA